MIGYKTEVGIIPTIFHGQRAKGNLNLWLCDQKSIEFLFLWCGLMYEVWKWSDKNISLYRVFKEKCSHVKILYLIWGFTLTYNEALYSV